MNDHILKAREERFEHIKSISKNYKTLILIKSNTPGQNKERYSSFFLLNIFHGLIENQFKVIYKTFKKGFDGPYYVYAIQADQLEEIKDTLIDIETSHPLGRLIDLDLYQDQKLVSREDFNLPLRTCMLCEKPAIACMREQTHTLEELLLHIDISIVEFLKKEISHFIKQAMLNELNLDPKFGLVTPTSSGSHPDMNYKLMYQSIDILMPYFLEIFELGMIFDDDPNLFDKANHIGRQAEKEMYLFTNDVNTYKGLIYILGFVLLSIGHIIKNSKPSSDIYQRIKELSFHVLDDFKSNIMTAGINAFKTYQIKGIRGEVFNGLPTVKKAFNYFKYIDILDPKNYHHILLFFMIHSEDTVLLNRSGSLENYQHFKAMSSQVNPYIDKDIKDFTNYCIKHNISFGGSADLFIVFQFIHQFSLFYT
ncbi:holo-ACP synthase CitX [Tenericutes bacterium MZ-XQ]|nr:holo-ACP synthase CitX [Tenericutes bacterium MZ-XQ]